MTSYITPPPAEIVVPLTAGCGRALTLENRDTATGERIDWPQGSAVVMVIDAAEPISIAADLQSYNAALTVSTAICNQLRTGTRFRIIHDTGSLERALMVGRFVRHDG